MPSIEELIREVSSIKSSSDQLATMVGAAADGISGQSNLISGLVRGSKTGQEAVMSLSVASTSLRQATASMKDLSRTCDDCVNNLSK